MHRTLLVPGAILLASFGMAYAVPNSAQEKPESAEPKMTPEDAARKNPVPPTPEGLAEVRKLFGYNCAMCHGKNGDGKGDLAADMKLELRDWREASSIEKMTDGELFWIVSNGKGKMPGEGGRTTEKVRWNFVNLVRAFAKKGAGDKPKADSPASELLPAGVRINQGDESWMAARGVSGVFPCVMLASNHSRKETFDGPCATISEAGERSKKENQRKQCGGREAPQRRG